MSDVFLEVLNTSIAASWVVLAVVIARFLLRKAPRNLICSLWALVGARLVIGRALEAPFSLIPSAEVIPPESLFDRNPVIDSGVPIIDRVVNPVYTESFRADPFASVNPLQIWMAVWANLWVLGMIVMLLWAFVSWLRIRRQVRESIEESRGVYLCDRIDSPFILGIIRPKIYLPSDLNDDVKAHVIAHERAHIARRDHWWKPLGYLLLTIYWFNPVLWLAYILLCRDIEMACDERVVRDMVIDEKKAYSAALLQCSISRRAIAACPLAFGEVGVKARIKSVLSYKKPAFWVILVTVVLIAVLALGFLTDPISEPEPFNDRLGIHLTAMDVTPTGMKLVCTIDNDVWESINTGSAFYVARQDKGDWVELPVPGNTVWTAIAYLLPMDGALSWDIDWSSLYGELEPGRYRIYKEFTGTRSDVPWSDIEFERLDQRYYAEFTIE